MDIGLEEWVAFSKTGFIKEATEMKASACTCPVQEGTDNPAFGKHLGNSRQKFILWRALKTHDEKCVLNAKVWGSH